MGITRSRSPRESESERIYRRPDSSVWWCSYTTATGERKRESTGCANKKDAREFLEQRELEARDPGHAKRASATLRDALKALVDDRQLRAESATADRSIATAKFYLSKSRVLLAGLGRDALLVDLTPAVLDEYVARRRREKVKDSTIHKELTSLRAALRLAKRAGLWAGDVDALLPEVSGQSTPRERWLTERELELVLNDLIERGAHDRAARVAFVVATSAEWIATERATRADVTDDRTVVRVRGSKRETRDRETPIARPWQHDLLAIATLFAGGEGELLFRKWLHSNSIRELGQCATRAKIERFSWNDLRRTCAQWMRRDGVSLELVSAVLGHADTRMVSRVYGRLDARELGRQIAGEGARADGITPRIGPLQ
jgi:integrase